jgi:hypothetical protein
MGTQIVSRELPSNNSPLQNILINGGMEFWQRGTTFAALANNTYAADRWKLFFDGGANITISRDAANVDSGTYSMKFQVNNAGTSSYAEMYQAIENALDYNGKTLSVSVRVKATTGIKVYIYDGTFAFSAAHSGGNTFETLTVTKTISTSGTLAIIIGYDAADGGGVSPSVSTSYFDSVMLVLGPSAVSFVPKDVQVEFAQCQRYFQVLGGNAGEYMISGPATSTTAAQVPYRFPVQMRIAPVPTVNNPTDFFVITSGGSGISLSSFTTANVTTQAVRLLPVISSASLVAGNCTIIGVSTGTGTIFFSAEL